MALTDFNECLTEYESIHPDCRPEVLKTWREVRKQKRDKLAKQLKKLRKAVDSATVSKAGMSDEHKAYMAQMPEEKRGDFTAMSASERDTHMANNPIKKFTGEVLERFGKFAVAIVDKQIDLQIAISKRAGESDIQAYNRAITENPALYQAYEIAKRAAVPDPALCTWP